MHSMNAITLASAIAFTLISIISAHSLLGDPKPTASNACRLGGVPSAGISLCPGPCDIRARPRLTGPKKPSAQYYRGEKVTVKYQRNNHGPGGFIRFTIVPVDKMMDKKIHARNAFHYSCWGANTVLAKANEKGRDRYGFSLVGGDGALHNLSLAYYAVNITIPSVIPDGTYVLGWVWFGGIGGSIYQNKPQNPYPLGLFGDYWSCAFIRIKGGQRVSNFFRPQFNNDMSKYWNGGCYAANNSPGQCVYEPCMVPAKVQIPGVFKEQNGPPPLIPRYFKTSVSKRKSSIPTPVPYRNILQDALVALSRFKTNDAPGIDSRWF